MRFDLETTPQRSRIMQRIRGKDTGPEVAFRKALWCKGIRYRKNDGRLVGRPDISISRQRIAIFIDGEFWHGFEWEKKRQRLSANREYWIQKIERNMQRDRDTDKILTDKGWTVLRFWASSVAKNPQEYVQQVLDVIQESSQKETICLL